jgi:hypothetical protein
MTGKRKTGGDGGGGGEEGAAKRKHKKKTSEEDPLSGGRSMTKMKKIDGTLIQMGQKDAEDTVHLPGFNLAGRPEALKTKDGGIKKSEVKTVGPYHTGNVNTESYWHFVVRSNKNEWIRFNPDSISVVVYGTMDNPKYLEGSNDPLKKTKTVALQAGIGAPRMFLDPSVMGTSFVYRVDASINNVPVPTNSAIGGLLLHYVRCARVFNHQARDCFVTNKDVTLIAADEEDATRNSLSAAMKKAVSAFDYFDPLTNKGARVPVYLDGQFPFDRRNATLESIDRQKEQNLFFPPDTTVEIKLHLYRSKAEAIFHHQLTLPDYFNPDKLEVDAPNADIQITFQDVTLEYESVELKAAEHVKAMKQYMDGGVGLYDYDIVRGQHQAMEAGQSTTQSIFQIAEYCRLIYIIYIPDWATFPMERTRKPLSAFSRYPTGCTGISLSFAGERHLITQRFENFGVASTNNEISKKILFSNMKENRMLNFAFEKMFSRSEDEYCLNQGFVLDVKHLMSDKTEMLTIQHEFATSTSPNKLQVVCISVHPNGRATCRAGSSQFEWIWSFANAS